MWSVHPERLESLKSDVQMIRGIPSMSLCFTLTGQQQLLEGGVGVRSFRLHSVNHNGRSRHHG